MAKTINQQVLKLAQEMTEEMFTDMLGKIEKGTKLESEYNPKLKHTKLETKLCVIEIMKTKKNKDNIIIRCVACNRIWVKMKCFQKHIVKNECSNFKTRKSY